MYSANVVIHQHVLLHRTAMKYASKVRRFAIFARFVKNRQPS